MYKRAENRASGAAGLARGWLDRVPSFAAFDGRWRGGEGRVVSSSRSVCRQQRDAAEWWTAYR